jgi:basic membrane protein A and related proteins
MRKLVPILIAAAVAVMFGVVTSSYAAPFKVCYIYPSPAADVGWAKQLDLGREAVEKAFPGKVQSVVVQNVPEGPDAARVMNQFVNQGCKVEMLGSFGYMNDGLRLAKQHPDIVFIHASGYKQAKNFGTFQVRNYQGAYVAGMAAGMVTKTNTLGVVAAYAVPEVIGIIDGFTLGARKTNPKVNIKVVWLNSWFDPPKAQDSARALISQGADVLFSLYQDTPSVVTVAEQKGVYVVNTSSDMKKYAPKHLLVSIEINWAPYFTRVVKEAMAGTFVGTGYWSGFSDGAIKMASWSSNLTPAQRKTLDETVAAIAAGKLKPFTGPIRDQSGAVRLKSGETMPDKALFAIDWLVQGVETKIPKS